MDTRSVTSDKMCQAHGAFTKQKSTSMTTLHWKNLNSPSNCIHQQHNNNKSKNTSSATTNNNNNSNINPANQYSLKSNEMNDLDINFARCTTATNRRRKNNGNFGGSGNGNGSSIGYGTSSSLHNVPKTRSHRQSLTNSHTDWFKQSFDDSTRQHAVDRLTKLKNEIERKSIKIRNLKSVLDQLHITDNIDLRIRQAELEYAISREELQLMSLAEEMRSLKISLEKYSNDIQNLYNNLCSGADFTLHAIEVKSGHWSLQEMPEGSGIFLIEWCLDNECNGLRIGDRLLELNGQLVNSKSKGELKQITNTNNNTNNNMDKYRMVVIRKHQQQKQQQQQQQQHQQQQWQQSYEYKSQPECAKEKENNLLLQHRITYLEEQVKELQAYKHQQNSMHEMHKEKHKQFGHITSISISSSPAPVATPTLTPTATPTATPPASISTSISPPSPSLSPSPSPSSSQRQRQRQRQRTSEFQLSRTANGRPLIYQRGNYITTLIGGKPIELMGADVNDNDDIKSSIDVNERVTSERSYPLLSKSKSTSHITKTLIQGYGAEKLSHNSNNSSNSNNSNNINYNNINANNINDNIDNIIMSMKSKQISANNFNINFTNSENNLRRLNQNNSIQLQNNDELFERKEMQKKIVKKLYTFEDQKEYTNDKKVTIDFNRKPSPQNSIDNDNMMATTATINTLSHCYMNKVKKYLSPDNNNGTDTDTTFINMRPKPPKKPLRLSLSLQRSQNLSADYLHNNLNTDAECNRALKRAHLTQKNS